MKKFHIKTIVLFFFICLVLAPSAFCDESLNGNIDGVNPSSANGIDIKEIKKIKN